MNSATSLSGYGKIARKDWQQFIEVPALEVPYSSQKLFTTDDAGPQDVRDRTNVNIYISCSDCAVSTQHILQWIVWVNYRGT